MIFKASLFHDSGLGEEYEKNPRYRGFFYLGTLAVATAASIAAIMPHAAIRRGTGPTPGPRGIFPIGPATTLRAGRIVVPVPDIGRSAGPTPGSGGVFPVGAGAAGGAGRIAVVVVRTIAGGDAAGDGEGEGGDGQQGSEATHGGLLLRKASGKCPEGHDR